MNSTLQHQFELAESQRHNLLDQLRHVSTDQFHKKPSPAKWSIQEILAHLISAEKLSLLYIKKKILGIESAGDTGIWHEIKIVVLRISQHLPLKFNAPKVVVQRTLSYKNLNELEDDWNHVRRELSEVLGTLGDHQIKKKIYKHVFAGRLNVVHALIFFREHIHHHWPQINRLLK